MENKISQPVAQFAANLGIVVSDFNCDEQVLDAAFNEISRLRSQFAENPEQVNSLNLLIGKYSAMPQRIKELENEVASYKLDGEVKQMIDQAITDGKVTPNQREGLMSFGRKAKEDLKTFLDKAPKLAVFKNDQVTVITPDVSAEDKFKNEDGSAVTFAQYCKAKTSSDPKDVELVGKFKDDEVKKLPGYDKISVL